MTNLIVTISTLVSLILISCQNNFKNNNAEDKKIVTVEKQSENEMTDIPFIVAKNYFVKNKAKSLDNPKIETAEKFNEIFGKATTMAEDGMPTEIDFNKQYVIAVMMPETNIMTAVVPISLQKNKEGNITLTYKLEKGQKQSYTLRPALQIIVDKTENGILELKEQN